MQKLRGIAFAAFLYSSGAIFGLIASPVLLFGENAPRSVAKLWTRMALSALKHIAGVTYRLEGLDLIPEGGAIIAVNHQSMWETIALYHLMPRPVIVFKKELTHVPIYGWFVSRAGNIAVDRKGGPKALRAMREQAANKIKEGCQVIIFPEGTRVRPGERAKFHPGVAGVYTAAKAPCVPAAHNSGLFWRYPGPEKVPGEITLKFLPPISPGLNRKDFLSLLKEEIDGARPDLIDAQSSNTGSSDG